MHKTTNILFIGILLLAAFFRLYGVNWDQNQHLHPDERFLTMVGEGIKWPKNLQEYLNTETSSLNPHNRGFGFFVYGTFPIFFTKWVAESLEKGDYTNITLIGRQLSALFDLGTVVFVFLIGKQINTNQLINKSSNQLITNKRGAGLLNYWLLDNWIIGLLAAFFYAASVLPIQLSHFFAVDTYLTFFITLTFYLCIKLFTATTQSSKQIYQILKIKYLGQKPISLWLKIYKLNIKDLIYITSIGFSFGLALSSKITAFLFLPIIILFFIIISMKLYQASKSIKTKIFNILYLFFIFNILFLISTYFTFRFTQPYAFANQNIFDITPNPKVIENWKQLKSFDDPGGGFPPAVQWIKTKPFIFPLKNLLLWGLGMPLGVVSLLAVMYQVASIMYQVYKRKIYLILDTRYLILNLSLFWIILLFLYQGAQFSKAMRYFIPIYPFLSILSGYFTYRIFQIVLGRYQILKIKNQIYILNFKNIKIFNFLYAFFIFNILFLILLYPLSFTSIYSHPHSRIQASEWIYKNIPEGSFKSDEHWDDGLPLSLPIPGMIHEKYTGVEFPLYGADTEEKWRQMDERLRKVDYIFLTSNRLYGSLMTAPEKYPTTYRYYQMLFDGSLGFAKVVEFTSRPNLPIPFIKTCLTPPFVRYGVVALKSQECSLSGISFVDDYADEVFTVYDHPKVIIFKKIREVDYRNVLSISL